MAGEKKYYLIHLSGLVQGVGMRYFVHGTAQNLGLRGYVRNLPDGRVEAVLCDTEENLEHFITLLDKSPRGRIDNIKVNDFLGSEDFKDFTIRY